MLGDARTFIAQMIGKLAKTTHSTGTANCRRRIPAHLEDGLPKNPRCRYNIEVS